MKTFTQIARRIVSSLYARNEPDFASTHIPTVHHPHSQGDEYLAGMPRRAHQDDHLAGFPRRAIMDVVHGWKIPSPSGRLPVDD
jgi:hypothetical protein